MSEMSGSGGLISIGNLYFALLVQPDLGVELVANTFKADEGACGIIVFF